MRKRKWTEEQLRISVTQATSIRQLLTLLGLREAGGNYKQVKQYIAFYNLDVTHFRGMGWSRGLTGIGKPRKTIDQILVEDSSFQSYKLKKRLFATGMKLPKCERCGWAEMTKDGRIPLELDHVNGNNRDNRLENLRILCPNCHSLQPTHRGRNIKK